MTGQTIRNAADDSGEGPVYSIEVDMAKFGNYDVENMEVLCGLGKAISSPERVEILQLLYDKSLIIGEIARQMNLPASSTAYHLKILEQAGLIRMEEQPGTRGGQKLLFVFRVSCLLAVFLGAQADFSVIWNVADITMGGMAVLNIVVILLLGGTAVKVLRDYEEQKKRGVEPVFRAEELGIENTECWGEEGL